MKIKMKVKASLKLACADCFYVRRGKNLYIRCTTNPRHKRRQGFSTLNYQDTPQEQTMIDQFSLHTLPTDHGQNPNSEHGPACYHCKKAIRPLSLFRMIEIQNHFAEKK